MESNAREPNQKENPSSWEIVVVDLDDIEVPEDKPNDKAIRIGQDPLEFDVQPDNNEFGIKDWNFTWPSYKPVSLFDRFPEQFVGNDTLPYSAMVQHPGQVPECLDNNSPSAEHVVARRPPNNVDGETLMEQHLKRGSSDPYAYFFRVAAFCCLMDLNSQGLIHPVIFAILIGRIFNGDSSLLLVLNRYFMPPGFRIVYITTRAAVHNILNQMKRQIDATPHRSYHPKFGLMLKVLAFMDQERTSQGVHQDETIGRLVSTSCGREFRPHPGAFAILRSPQLSERFMKRTGHWWPNKEVTWREADLMGLYNPTEPKSKDAVETVDPRRLTVRRKTLRINIRREDRGESRAEA